MAQVFQPPLVLALKLGAIAVLLFVFVALLGWRISIAPHPAIGSPVEQAVPFSHKHHVGDVGLDCRYCHTSVAESPRAGLPPTHTCMSCHSQIWTGAPMLAPVRASLANNKALKWNRVAVLPDYVFFRHDIHIAKGVGCVECHGRIDRMALTYRAVPLTMQFCLDCHRDPGPRLRPKDQITNMAWAPAGDRKALGQALVAQYGIRVGQITYCSVCHR